MRLMDTASFDELYALSVERPGDYWEVVLRYCDIVWERPGAIYLDEARGAPFPNWFPGRRLNWVSSVFAWADRDQGGSCLAVIAERENGTTESIDRAGLLRQVATFAAGLRGLGVARGDRVGLLMESGIEACVAVLALSWLGAIVVPLFSGFGAEAIGSRLAGCKARGLISTTGFHRRGQWIDKTAAVRAATADLEAFAFTLWKGPHATPSTGSAQHDWDEVARNARPLREPESMAPDDPFMVIYTSGTTGKPKGAVHTHGGFPLKIAHDAAVHFDTGPGDVFCWPADMGWIAGTLVMTSALIRGATLVCYDGAPDFPDWSRMSRVVARHRVTHYGSSPTLIRGLASHAPLSLAGDLSSLKLLITAGETIDPEHFDWFQQHFGDGTCPVINYTGGTEVSGALLASVVVKPITPGGFNSRSPGIEVDVVDAQGNAVMERAGELVVRRPFVGMTRSFWEDDERYLQTYWSAIPGIWVHGDLAQRHANGSFFMLGRSDDTLKLAGKRVGPAEVEAVMLEMPGVDDAAAIGVADPLKGEKLVVFVVANAAKGATDAELSLGVQARVAERLGKAFRPARVHVVQELPKTRTAKTMRRLIRSAYCGNPLGDLTALANPAALDGIRDAANESID
nr:AMP-binding protein [Hydrogenophaga palleronii]